MKAGKSVAEDASLQEKPPPDPSRAAMDDACNHMAGAYAHFRKQCDDLELLLEATERNMGEIRKAQGEARAAGIRLIGLTTSYLAELNSYMKLIDK